MARDLVPAFVKLLKDNEAEVRTAIAGQIPGFCGLVERSVLLNEIMGTIEDLVSDSSQTCPCRSGHPDKRTSPRSSGKQEYVRLPGSRCRPPTGWCLLLPAGTIEATYAAHVPPDAQGRVPRGPPATSSLKLELVNQVIRQLGSPIPVSVLPAIAAAGRGQAVARATGNH